jgi:hypothetical protein
LPKYHNYSTGFIGPVYLGGGGHMSGSMKVTLPQKKSRSFSLCAKKFRSVTVGPYLPLCITSHLAQISGNNPCLRPLSQYYRYFRSSRFNKHDTGFFIRDTPTEFIMIRSLKFSPCAYESRYLSFFSCTLYYQYLGQKNL